MARLSKPKTWFEPERVESAEEWARLEEQYDRVKEEKRRALADPGPGWREWWFRSASKWYIGLGLLIADAWIVTFWIEEGSVVAAFATLAVLLYLEFLLYQYLWYRPAPTVRADRAKFRPSWHRPVRFGRWTPEADLARIHPEALRAEDGPDLHEFV